MTRHSDRYSRAYRMFNYECVATQSQLMVSQPYHHNYIKYKYQQLFVQQLKFTGFIPTLAYFERKMKVQATKAKVEMKSCTFQLLIFVIMMVQLLSEWQIQPCSFRSCYTDLFVSSPCSANESLCMCASFQRILQPHCIPFPTNQVFHAFNLLLIAICIGACHQCIKQSHITLDQYPHHRFGLSGTYHLPTQVTFHAQCRMNDEFCRHCVESLLGSPVAIATFLSSLNNNY